jgi:hypothetical protein
VGENLSTPAKDVTRGGRVVELFRPPPLVAAAGITHRKEREL